MRFTKTIMAAVLTAATALTLNAGAPTIMFLPDKTWCVQHNFVDRKEYNGKIRVTERYEDACRYPEMNDVLDKLKGLMQENGLNPKDFLEQSQADDDEEAEEEAYDSDIQSGQESDGGEQEMTDYERMTSKLKPDIIIKVGWTVNTIGFNKSMNFRLDAIDSYSNKSVATIIGTTPQFKGIVSEQLLNAATEQIDGFVAKLQNYFDDVQENGREITVTCRIGNNGSGVTFDTMFDGEPLYSIIKDWIFNNTVNHVYTRRGSGKNKLSFEQVRIPLKDSKGDDMDATKFVQQLSSYLAKKYNLKSKNRTKGLGIGRLYQICQ